MAAKVECGQNSRHPERCFIKECELEVEQLTRQRNRGPIARGVFASWRDLLGRYAFDGNYTQYANARINSLGRKRLKAIRGNDACSNCPFRLGS